MKRRLIRISHNVFEVPEDMSRAELGELVIGLSRLNACDYNGEIDTRSPMDVTLETHNISDPEESRESDDQ